MTETKNETGAELERCIEDLLSQKKSDIEKSLAEAIEQEKEKARQKTVELEREFEKGKEALDRHQTMLGDVRTATESVRERVGKHVEQAGHCRIMVRRLADKIGEECRNAEELGREIDDLLGKADKESARLRSELESRYGLCVPIVDMAVRGGLGAELEEALKKLSLYREGLIALDADESPVGVVPESSEAAGEAPAAFPGDGGNGVDPEAVSRVLELLLKTETVPDVGAFRMYRNDGYTVLDGRSILEEADRIIGEARALHERLAGTKSGKEQYYIKRDILSRQESLRKLVKRAIEICERETGDLPLLTNDILSVETLMDIQERLNIGNWSDANDLGAFKGSIETLRSALSLRLTDMASYGKAILEQLHETL